MDEKKGLTEVFDAIQDTLDTPIGDVCKEITVDAINNISPILGATISVGLQRFNEIKLRYLLKGLASDLNMEKRLNQLRNYVMSSTSRAFTVANVFREAIAANSPKICLLYGIILSKHLGKQGKDFSHDDILVCHALENASDYDLDIYKEIMTNCVTTDKKIAYKKQDKKKYDQTCTWCLYNRLFIKRGYICAELSGDYDDISDDIDINTGYCVESAAELLLELIDTLKRIWDNKHFI